MNIFDSFPSKYLKSSDLRGQNCKVTMERVEVEAIGEDRRPIIYFRGKEKGLVLNKTNANTIADMHGANTNNWPGKEIVIYPTRVDFKGERVDAIRIQYLQPQRQERPSQQMAQQQYDERNPPPQDDMNDEVPF